MTQINSTSRLSLGQVVATPAALEELRKSDHTPQEFLRRHLLADWGDLPDEDKAANSEALVTGERIHSSYTLSNGKQIWIITEAEDEAGQRSATTFLLPSEY
jgi:hypothetical protein